jgi:sugar-specific transcriptional regulator TrmB
MKEEIEKRKKELQKQHDDLMAKINEGKQAIANMEISVIGIKGAIQQCDWTLNVLKKEKDK